MQLFRQQALNHRNRLHGEIFLVQPLRWQAISWLLFGAMCATALFLTFGTYSRTIPASGVIRPTGGMGNITVPEDGAIVAMPVQDGDPVRRGQLVARLQGKTVTPRNGGTIDLIASRDGLLTALHNQNGDALTKGAIYARILPQSNSWQVQLRIATAALARIAPGQEVFVTLSAYPVADYGVLHGVIDHVGAAPIEAAEPYFLVTARLDPLNQRQRQRGVILRPDLALTARIVLDRRSYLQWLLNPNAPASAR